MLIKCLIPQPLLLAQKGSSVRQNEVAYFELTFDIKWNYESSFTLYRLLKPICSIWIMLFIYGRKQQTKQQRCIITRAKQLYLIYFATSLAEASPMHVFL